MCLRACVRACVPVCARVCLCACARACLYLRVCVCMRASMCMCLCACAPMCSRACLCARMYVRACLCMRVPVCVIVPRVSLVGRGHQHVLLTLVIGGDIKSPSTLIDDVINSYLLIAGGSWRLGRPLAAASRNSSKGIER